MPGRGSGVPFCRAGLSGRPDSRTKAWALGNLFANSGAGIKSSRYVGPIVAKSGCERTIEWSSKALKDASGRIIGVLAIGHDITELRAAQQRALQSERLAAIGEMVAVLTHEGRNALHRGQVCLEMLALEVEDRPEALRLIARLQQAQDDLLTPYEDVRGYAAPIHLERRACDLAEVWRSAWTHLAPLREGRGAVLREEIEGLDPHCAVDPLRLEQVFRNILENSLAACRDPVKIAIHCAAAEVDGPPALRVAVRDHGPGLGAEQKQRLFEPFYTTKTKGTGLGLSIAQRIVEAHGGRIAAGEDGGPGAEIILVLPRGTPCAVRRESPWPMMSPTCGTIFGGSSPPGPSDGGGGPDRPGGGRARHRKRHDPSDRCFPTPFQGLTIKRELQPNGSHPGESAAGAIS